MIKLTAKTSVQKDKIEEYKKLTERLIEESRKEEGCISYELYQDRDHEEIFMFIETWKDQGSIDFHNNTPHFTEIVPKMQKISASETELNHMHLVR